MESKPSIKGPTAQVAGFGKHPAWSDHIENLGSMTPLLSKFEGEVYLGAIGSLVTSGDWPAASSDHAMAGVLRRFLWQKGPEFIFGWMWPSADQVGRDHYPMMLCAQVSGCTIPAVLPAIDPLFRQAREAVRSARTKAEVQEAVKKLQADVVRAVQGLSSEGEDTYLDTARHWASARAMERTHWARLLYFLRTQYADAGISHKPKVGEFESIRVPAGPGSPTGSLSGWLSWLRTQIHGEEPVLVLQGDGADWCDIAVGRMTAAALKPILGGPQEVYPVTAVPFDLSAEFLAEADAAMASVGAPWNSPGKITIFGPAPARYHPVLPCGAPQESQTTRFVREEVAAARRLPLIPILAGLAVLAILVVVAVFLLGGSGKAPEPGSLVPPPAATPVPAPQAAAIPPAAQAPPPPAPAAATLGDAGAGSTPTALWRRYWDHYNQVGKIAADAPAGTLWAEQVRSALDGLDPRVWDPWTVVFGGRDRVPGAEMETISSSKLASNEKNLQRGAAAAARLLDAATNGYLGLLQARIAPMAGGPAAGVAAAWRKTLTPVAGEPAAARVTAAWGIEAALGPLSEAASTWSNRWRSASALAPEFAPAVLQSETRSLGQETDPARLAAALRQSAAALEATTGWGDSAVKAADPAYLGARLAAGAGTPTWTFWSNAVAGSRREVPADDVANVERRIQAAAAGDNLRQLHELKPSDADGFADRFKDLGNRLAEIRKTPLVRDNAGAVKAFRDLDADSAKAAEQLQTAWASVASPSKLVEIYRAERKLTSPVQELWSAYGAEAARRVDREAGDGAAGGAAAARKWKAVMDGAWTRFTSLDRAPEMAAVISSPWADRVADDVWRKDLWSVFLQQAVDPASLAVREDAAAWIAGEVLALRATMEAARGLQAAWRDGAWTNTEPLRRQILEGRRPTGFAASATAFGVQDLTALARNSASKPLDALAAVDGSDPAALSAACERLGAEPAWPKTDAQWRACCELAARAAKTPAWTDASPRKAWFAAQWRKRVGDGVSLAEASSIAAAVSRQPDLAGWLPGSFAAQQAWSQVWGALQGGRMAEAGKAAAQMTEDVKAGRLADTPENLALLGQFASLKLPDDPFDRVDWDAMAVRLHAACATDAGRREAQFTFPQGIRIAFVLAPDPSLKLLVARTEFSAGDMAKLLNERQNHLADGWLAKGSAELRGARWISDGQVVDSPVSVWNNVSFEFSSKGRVCSASAPRFPPGSKLAGASGKDDLGTPAETLPANCLSGSAALGAATALGCRLPTAAEWGAVSRMAPAGAFVCRPKSVDTVVAGLKKAWLDQFPDAVAPEIPFSCEAGSVKADVLPGRFFQDVQLAPASPAGLDHWYGNVAEYLYDPDRRAFSVAGGSFACPSTQPREVKDPSSPLVDAGLRLVVDRVDRDDASLGRQLLAKVRFSAN